MIRTMVKVLAFSLALAGSAHAADSYPRLATYAISSPHDYWESSYYTKLAKLDLAILTIYPGWGSSRNITMNTLVKQIKALNPNTKVFVYVLPESLRDPADAVWNELSYKIDREKWWLYTSGIGTTQVGASFVGNYLLNISPTSRKDSTGKTYGQWFASFVASEFATPNPALDGIYTDNVFWKPRKDAPRCRGTIASGTCSTSVH
jgi:hypothetical protein